MDAQYLAIGQRPILPPWQTPEGLSLCPFH